MVRRGGREGDAMSGWHTANMVCSGSGACRECGNSYYHARDCRWYNAFWEDDPSCPFSEDIQRWKRQAEAFDACWRY